MEEIKLTLSPWQRTVWNAIPNYRFVVVSAGRQSGKTFLCVAIAVLKAMHEPKKIVWWVAPIYLTSRMAMRRVIDFCLNYKIPHEVNKSELTISFPNRSVIFFKSADKEEGLRSETVDFMVIDEMGLIKRDSWQYALRGTITATRAQVFFIGTPKGKNLFYELYIKGQDGTEKDYISFQYESRENPLFTESEWIDVQRMPERVFQQEYQAKFIDDGGEVFRNIRSCVKGGLQRYIPQKKYFAGVDLAKSFDYTVICILDQDGHLCAYDRFNDISWTVQKERVIKLCNQYDAYTMLDSTGLGDPILDDLSPCMRVEGYKFSNISKRQLIEALSIAIERGEISFPEIPELIDELNSFTFEQTDGGVMKYSAPEGLHDDIVIALALANWGYGGGKGTGGAISDIDGREMIHVW